MIKSNKQIQLQSVPEMQSMAQMIVTTIRLFEEVEAENPIGKTERIRSKRPLREWCRSGCGKLDASVGGGGDPSVGGERIVTVFLLLTPHSVVETESSSCNCITPVIALSTFNKQKKKKKKKIQLKHWIQIISFIHSLKDRIEAS